MSKEVFTDYYELLGVSLHAPVSEIRAAYVQKAKEHHPDTGGQMSAMEGINKAYGVLKEDKSRRAYDLLHQVHTGASALQYRMTGEKGGDAGTLAGMSEAEIDAFVNEAFVSVASDSSRGSIKKKAKKVLLRRKKRP